MSSLSHAFRMVSSLDLPVGHPWLYSHSDALSRLGRCAGCSLTSDQKRAI